MIEKRGEGEMKVCPECKGKSFDKGWVSGEGAAINFGVEYKSDNRKLLRGGVPIRAQVCLNCGHVELLLNVDKLKEKLRK
jgi:hypothetical protein